MNDSHKCIEQILCSETNFFKRMCKKIVLKIVRPVFEFYEDKLQNSEIVYEEKINELENELKKLLTGQTEYLKNKIQLAENEHNNANTRIVSDLRAVVRQLMLVKWQLIDHLSVEEEKPDDIITCKICGNKHRRSEYEIKEAECIFNGGHLKRYICPDCGVIFGPGKFEALGQKGIEEDYRIHYLGFDEGNSINKEERAFYMLKPEKGRRYLNYGCGKWSKSLQELREHGYDVYGYEPYAPEIDNPYLITDKDQLKKMRFDGIYSNDVLEHLLDPVNDLIFMKSILIYPWGKMSHCTSCYIYKYEFTRFHTHFFTGDSIRVLTQKAGLEIEDYCDDMENNDFICYVYKMTDHFNLIHRMFVAQNAVIENQRAMMKEDSLIYGPYLDLFSGTYILYVNTNAEMGQPKLRITSGMGKNILLETELQNGINKIEFQLDRLTNDTEFLIINDTGVLNIEEIWIEGK